MRAKTTLWLLAIAALAGCGDILGLEGYGDQDGSVDAAFDAPSGDAASDASGDAKSDAAPIDAGSDAAACPSSFVCVAAPPSGWAWAVYDPDARPACATGWATPTDVEEGIDAGAASCGCSCTTTAPSCATGNLTINSGNNNTCDNGNTQTDPADSGACGTLTSFSTGGGSKVSVAGPPPSGGSCSPTPSKSVPAVGYAHQGRTCAFDGDASACGAGSLCVPDPSPFATCVSQLGVVACPSGFPTQHLVGTSVADTRDCSACTCAFDAGACTGTATLYTNTSCSQGANAITADGTCNNVGNHTWHSYAYAAKSSASCGASTSLPDGGVVFGDPTTVCCP